MPAPPGAARKILYNCREKGFRAKLPPLPKNPAYNPDQSCSRWDENPTVLAVTTRISSEVIFYSPTPRLLNMQNVLYQNQHAAYSSHKLKPKSKSQIRFDDTQKLLNTNTVSRIMNSFSKEHTRLSSYTHRWCCLLFKP